MNYKVSRFIWNCKQNKSKIRIKVNDSIQILEVVYNLIIKMMQVSTSKTKECNTKNSDLNKMIRLVNLFSLKKVTILRYFERMG